MRVAALAGGVGGSKLLLGLAHAMDPASLTAIVNTGDDITLHGLHIAPDLDTVMYTLAGVVNPSAGWGIAGDTFHVLEALRRFGGNEWFNLGDRDLATHLRRTELMRAGRSLTEVTDDLRRAFGVASRILPMCDVPVPTRIETATGWIHFQDYFVRQRAEPAVRAIRFDGIERAAPAPGMLEAIAAAERVVLCPSNPLISIGPILAVPGVRDALRQRRDAVIAVCPLVGGKSLKGPSDRMMHQLGYDVSAAGVARMYADIAGTLVIDSQDAAVAGKVEALGVRPHGCTTVMRSLEDKVRLAREVLGLA